MPFERKAVTIIEIIIVVLIIGIAVVVVSTAGYRRNIERQRSLEALNNLQLIYNAQKRRLLDKGEYYNCTSCASQDLTRELGILLTAKYFNYSISSSSSADVNTFRAVAVRRSGICKGKRMTVNQTSSDAVKECAAWK